MVQAGGDVADFSYGSPESGVRDAAGLPARVAIFADNRRLRTQVAGDLTGAGFRTVEGGEIALLLDGPITMLGDVVMVDCPATTDDGLDAKTLSALARLDMRVARSGSQLIVATSLEALDDVFGALDQSRAQILVQPSRAERLVAVGRVMTSVANGRVREMSEEDRLNLLHLSQQVEAIAHKLEGLSEHGTAPARGEGAASVQSPSHAFGSARPSLPDPRLVRQIIASRQARARFFDSDLFADPAWDMLLDLTAAHAENAKVSVTSLCIAAGVPATTALRWLNQMVESGIFEREADTSDRRRAFIVLSKESVDAMARYFALIETPMALAA